MAATNPTFSPSLALLCRLGRTSCGACDSESLEILEAGEAGKAGVLMTIDWSTAVLPALAYVSTSLCHVLEGLVAVLGGVTAVVVVIVPLVRVDGRSLHDIIRPIRVGGGSSAWRLMVRLRGGPLPTTTNDYRFSGLSFGCGKAGKGA